MHAEYIASRKNRGDSRITLVSKLTSVIGRKYVIFVVFMLV